MAVSLGIIASSISGHLWEPQGAYDALSTVIVPSGGLATITFAGIPTGYKHLQLRGFTLSNTAIASLNMRFNSDTAANYSFHNLEGTGSVAVGENAPNTSYIRPAYTGATANGSAFICDILDYADVNKFKTTKSLAGIDQNGSGYVNLWSGNWRSTSAINRIDITHNSGINLNQYSTFTLYGVR